MRPSRREVSERRLGDVYTPSLQERRPKTILKDISSFRFSPAHDFYLLIGRRLKAHEILNDSEIETAVAEHYDGLSNFAAKTSAS